MKETTITVTHPIGLHARPAARFYRTARTFKSRITIQNLSREMSSERQLSTIALIQMAVRQGHTIRIRAEGEDESEAIAVLTQLVEGDFGDS